MSSPKDQKPPAPDPSPEWFEPLVHSLRGLRESKQRMAKMVEEMRGKPADEIAKFLHQLSEKSSNSSQPHYQLHLDLLRHRELLSEIGYDTLSDVYQASLTEEWIDVLVLLRSGSTKTFDMENLPGGFGVQLESLTLGERKQLSRGIKRKSLELLLFDSNAMVIRELLMNPRITERDVVRTASRHQAPPEILEVICQSNRWLGHYHVRKALAFNPRTPLAYAFGLVRQLRRDDLRLFLQGGSRTKELLEAARSALAQKPQ